MIADLEEDLSRCMAQLKQASLEYDKLLKICLAEEADLTERLTEAGEELKLAKLKSSAAAAGAGGAGGAEAEELRQQVKTTFELRRIICLTFSQQLESAQAKIAKLSAAAKTAGEVEELREKLTQVRKRLFFYFLIKSLEKN